jgi:hypothetical protein
VQLASGRAIQAHLTEGLARVEGLGNHLDVFSPDDVVRSSRKQREILTVLE